MTAKLKNSTARKLSRLLKDQSPDRTHLPPVMGQNTVRVRNDAGVDIPRFGIVAPNPNHQHVIFPTMDVHGNPTSDFWSHTVLSVTGPFDAAYRSCGGFLVACEPIPIDGFGRAWYQGMFPVRVEFPANTLLWQYCDVQRLSSGYTMTHLVADYTGPCRVVWKPPHQYGVLWAIVQYDHNSSNDNIVWVSISNNSTHPMQGLLRHQDPWNPGSFATTGQVVTVYRFPTHITNNMYRSGGNRLYAAVKIRPGVYQALHAIPRDFDTWP